MRNCGFGEVSVEIGGDKIRVTHHVCSIFLTLQTFPNVAHRLIFLQTRRRGDPPYAQLTY
ncbi:hypothetical protein HanRHA438_Chr01g0035101 [Helianthus annuus]|nr:hypothetical protein HanRHA438_Chr01g0035101 [Helianthus annuus]KAJ0957928.1 hypothetical protein HanPSC8_Chr01g0033331 [Helianthus annuus]